ncbi:polymer-forming cytoskeletal protein [Microbacterium gallinarum]|uniref:Flp pilus-assembly TadG-like N-terminal domain-containing protein n=1 Tax=Microbacterium gallinarum TaxID=2762209 RepID=A0ABR8X3X6_9MICO|nr:polymer-forming cytoskeletal protein [Microbacterium gallinarum]MBD8023872.1 hypothetical protein [Microbacterium gallinarum]
MLAMTDRTRGDRDGGSTLVSVLVIMLVLSVGALTLAAIVTNTTGILVDSRSTAQSRAAADAGLADAIARAGRDDVCGAPLTPAAAFANGATYSVERDCTVSDRVRFTSTGTTPDGSRTVTEAVFEIPPAPAPLMKEPALVTRAPLDLSALTIKSVDPADPATVWVVPDAGVSGDFSCNSGGAIAGSVYLPAGTVFGAGGCEVQGDVYAEKSVTIGSGTEIRGDLVSLNGSVSITGGNTIDGSIYAKGDVNGSGLSGRFVESIHAVGNLNLAGGAPVARDRITYGGAFTYPHSGHDAWAVNSVRKTVVSPPQLPTAPAWEGFTQAELDALVASKLFTKVSWAGACTHSWNHPMKSVLESLTAPTLVDASGCTRVDLPGQWSDLKVKTDIIFVAPSFNLVGQNFISGDGNEHRIWMISPEVPGRNCAPVPVINAQGVKMSPMGSSKISGMIFTQCTVYFANASENWQGSIHAGTMTGKPNFWYKPVGFPGKEPPGAEDEDGGDAQPAIGRLISLRDLP